ncbi:CAVP-target protein-like [Mytilus edulis]|uniref:CAVP-target protein-like n=1 Tax=Mytilus edulis TaxID=6550 RepID=UPI0039F0D23F
MMVGFTFNVFMLCCTFVIATHGLLISKYAELEMTKACIGQGAMLFCDISGDPLPDYEWFKDGVKLEHGGRFNIRRHSSGSSRVIIVNLKDSDSGMYVCKASNSAGTETSSERLSFATDC